MGLLDKHFEDRNIIITSVDDLMNWARLSSLWFMQFGIAESDVRRSRNGDEFGEHSNKFTSIKEKKIISNIPFVFEKMLFNNIFAILCNSHGESNQS